MTTQNSNGSKHYFTGDYVEDLRDILIAAMLTNRHAALIGLPGVGKTSIPRTFFNEVCGPEHWGKLGFTPTTTPDRIEGHVDQRAFIETGNYELNIEKTPLNPNMRAFLFDELFRAGGAGFDSVIQVTDPENQDHCVCVATANFTSDETRVDAMRDRFSLWMYLPEQQLTEAEARQVMRAHIFAGGKPQIPGTLPTWEQIEDVRNATPTDRAYGLCEEYALELKREAEAENYRVHYRRLAQWIDLLVKTAIYYSGTNDFDTLPNEAKKMLRFAMPVLTDVEAADWRKVANAIVDRVGAIIDGIMSEAVIPFREIAGLPARGERTAGAQKLGMIMAQAQEQLDAAGRDDPRVKAAKDTLSEWFQMAMNGSGAIRVKSA